MSSKTITVIQDPERMRPSDIPTATGDTSAIRETIGWQPEIELRQTVENLLEHWKVEVSAG